MPGLKKSPVLKLPGNELPKSVETGYWLAFLLLYVGIGVLSALGKPVFLFGYSALMVVVLFVVYAYKREYLNLFLVLSAFVLITDNEPGIQLAEAAYGAYFLSFLSLWYIKHLFFYRTVILEHREDWALSLFLFYAVLSAFWSVMFGAKPGQLMGESLMLAMFLFYFPVKEVCLMNPNAVKYVFGVLLWLGFFVFVRNVLMYKKGLSSATYLWQIATGRIAMNEVLQMAPALVFLVLFVHVKSLKLKIGSLLLTLCFLGGLVLTQSRGYWVSFLIGAVTLFFLTDRKSKIVILKLAVYTTTLLVVVSLLFFNKEFLIIAGGVTERFGSLFTAITRDVSLVNRFHEAKAVWQLIKVNPIIGYGMAAPYRYYNLIDDVTRVWSYVHNGYVWLFFHYGLMGGGLMLSFLFGILYQAFQLFKSPLTPPRYRLVAVIAIVCYLAQLVVANTSNPFTLTDSILILTLLGGAVSAGHTTLKYLSRSSTD